MRDNCLDEQQSRQIMVRRTNSHERQWSGQTTVKTGNCQEETNSHERDNGQDRQLSRQAIVRRTNSQERQWSGQTAVKTDNGQENQQS